MKIENALRMRELIVEAMEKMTVREQRVLCRFAGKLITGETLPLPIDDALPERMRRLLELADEAEAKKVFVVQMYIFGRRKRESHST